MITTWVFIAIAVYVVGSYFDFKYSSLGSAAGAPEFNPLMKGKDGKFSPGRFEIFHIVFLAFVVISHFTWLPDDQKQWTAPGLIIVGLASLAVAFGVDRSRWRKAVKDADKPQQPTIFVNQV